jgi:Tfp pilus assembly protein PilZ
MRLLTIAYVSSAEFLSHYSDSHDTGALFFRTRTDLEKGEEVLMEVSYPGLPNRALVRGRVAGSKPGKGLWLAFDKADVSTRDFLLQLARGEIAVTKQHLRSHNRFPTDLPVEVEVEQNGTQETRAADLSARGAFIQSAEPPAVGTAVRLVIGSGEGDDSNFSIDGEVAWIGGEDEAQGYGVKFSKGGDDGRRLRALLRRASERARVDFAKENAGS